MKKILIIILILVCPQVGFAQIKAMEKALVSKDYARVIQIAEKYLNKRTVDKGQILYLLAEAHIGTSNLPKAREALRSLYKQFPNSEYSQKATLRIGDSYYLESNYEQAKKVYDYFLNKHKDTAYAASVYLKLAYCHEKLGNWTLKKSYMDTIAQEFPHNIEAEKLAELEKRGFEFVIQVGAFRDQGNARDLAARLKKDGFSAYVVKEKENGKVFYKARIGKFQKRADAESKLEALIRKDYPARIFP